LNSSQPPIERSFWIHWVPFTQSRSVLVHGRKLERREIVSAAGTAMAVARRALRSLYLDREDLIALSSDQRAHQLLVHEP
jgi:hypothetical protein